MSTVTYGYDLAKLGLERYVTVSLPRPDWWLDSTHAQRRVLEAQALKSDDVQHVIAEGFYVTKVRRPVCECIVQTINPRDPYYLGASGTCNICYGPLKVQKE